MTARLIPVGDCPSKPLDLVPGSRMVVGREAKADVRLDHPSISRRHAVIEHQAGRWCVIDLGSRHGTRVNGIPIDPQVPVPLGHGDRIELRPWSLRLDLAPQAVSIVGGVDDSRAGEQVRVAAVPEAELQSLARRRLSALLDSAALMHQARTEEELGDAVLDACMNATGFGRGLYLRTFDDCARIEVLRARPSDDPTTSLRAVSRSVCRAASQGGVVRLEDQSALQSAESIIGSGVTSALCAPVSVEGTVERLLYLDSMSGMSEADAPAFCNAVAQLCAISLSSLKRAEIDAHRRALLDELDKARAAQERIMPPPRGTLVPLRYAMSSVPGRHVAGDIFGIAAGPGGPTFFLGDVAGKGVGAAMMMAGIQAHLHAEFAAGRDLAGALGALGNYLEAHRVGNEFATLFAVQVDAEREVVRTVDAGHGYAIVIPESGPARLLSSPGGPPLGAISNATYEVGEAEFRPGMRILLFSDGLAEQPSPEGKFLGTEGVLEALHGCHGAAQDVEALGRALSAHAQSDAYADDVTVASIEWLDPSETATTG